MKTRRNADLLLSLKVEDQVCLAETGYTQLEEDIPATAQFTGGGATVSCRCVQERIGHTRRIRSKTDRRCECKSPIPESPPSPILDERGSRQIKSWIVWLRKASWSRYSLQTGPRP